MHRDSITGTGRFLKTRKFPFFTIYLRFPDLVDNKQGMPEGYVEQNILPDTQLGRLIRPEEIADAICFMVRNSAVSGQLWADAGWHPTAA